MTPEFGQISLITALCLSVCLAVIPMIGAWRNDTLAMNVAPSLALGLFVFLSLSFGCLTVLFLQDDFSVKVVASNSNSLLPTAYKFSAVWGNHEGSLLLWVWILSAWALAVAVRSRGLPLVVMARVLSVMGFIGVGFIAFSLLTSNPFERLLPGVAPEGADLNPLLQDPGLIIHPPLLYMGYVGLVVPFAFAIAVCRPCTSCAVNFLRSMPQCSMSCCKRSYAAATSRRACRGLIPVSSVRKATVALPPCPASK